MPSVQGQSAAAPSSAGRGRRGWGCSCHGNPASILSILSRAGAPAPLSPTVQPPPHPAPLQPPQGNALDPPPSSPPTTGCGPRASRTPQGLSPTEPSPPPLPKPPCSIPGPHSGTQPPPPSRKDQGSPPNLLPPPKHRRQRAAGSYPLFNAHFQHICQTGTWRARRGACRRPWAGAGGATIPPPPNLQTSFQLRKNI